MDWVPAEHRDRFRHAYGGRRVCITGGAGFIGGHLAEALAGLGASVAVIDDLSNSSVRGIASLVERTSGGVRFIYGSILEPEALEEAMDDAEVVFHLAAMGSVPRSLEEPERCMEVNLAGTLRVAEAARAAGVGRWVYSASSSAYGDAEELPKVETMPPNPLSPYAASKLAGEYVVRAWAVSYGLPGISLRYFNIFGPGQRGDSAYAAVIAAFATRLLAGERPVIHGDGTHSRDFTPVENAVFANLLAGSTERMPRGEVVNVGCGHQTTLLELLEVLGRLTGARVDPIFDQPRAGDVAHSVADLGRARELLGYEPRVTLEQGLQRTVAWYRRASGGGDGTSCEDSDHLPGIPASV